MQNRVALVFGGTGGLGSGCVRTLARDWSTVAITYRQARSKAEELAAELPHGQGFAVGCDVSDARSVREAIETVTTQRGEVGAIVFACGVAIEQPHISEITEEQWREVIDHELLGFIRVTTAIIPYFRAHGGGSIVAVTSMANTRFIVGDAISAVPKAGIETLSRGIAKEEGRYGIRSNTVAAGAMNAGLGERYIAQKFTPDFWEKFKKSIPLRAFGEASDIGEAVGYFASARAKYVTGQTIVVDGGYTL